ncbi:MAG: hypothetical protein ACFFEF_15500 [Candidatus Thorarchaeota archaeon]
MMRIITALEKHSNIRNLVFAIIASAATILAMSYGTKVLVYDIYGEFTMPDTRIAYTIAELEAILSSIDSEGLIIWSQIHLLDYIFPLTYFFALAFGISLELRTAYPERGKLKLLLLLPLVGCLMDYLENIFVLSQVLSYPNLSEPIIILASAFTTTKWVSLALSFVIILGLILVILYKRITSR